MAERGESASTDDKSRLLHSLTIDRQSDANGEPNGRWRNWAMVAGVVIAAGAGLWLVVPRSSERAEVAEPPLLQVHEKTVTQPPAAQSEPQRASGLIASGYVVARRKATIAAEVTGKVTELMVEEGMSVRQGQILARLDSVLAEKDLALAQSRVVTAEAAGAAVAADLRDAERILSRARSLSEQKITSVADLTKAEARTSVLREQLRQAEAQLATARLDVQRTAAILEKHQIRAPFDGVVVERSAQPGEMISPMSAGGFTRTGICTIVDMESIEIEVDVNESFIGRLKQGASVNAVLDAYQDWSIPSTVIAIVPTANREKATVKVRIGLKQKDPRIMPDMAVKVTFIAEAATAPGSNSPGAN